ncbi:MAG: hypothetical protein NC314_13600 [Roseburia sp.]|nr:hypothetical protein [Ruminococcus sp.]MCM1156694.1 hypothetical protein [Roseburia sp.]MCM1243872.1 hypothetical protein [Roseburia sp.]
MKIKKLFALSLAAAMIVSVPVMAADSPTVSAISDAAVTVTFDREGEAIALAAQASGIPMATTAAAASENKTVGEYMNNAVTEVPGLTDSTPIGQGGKVIINGAPSNQVFSTLKPYLSEVNSAKDQAAALGGTVLTVSRIGASVSFDTATVNFYMPGVKTGNNVQVYQLVDGQWNSLNVAEVRDDHVVVDLTSLGTFAFIEVPAAQ